MQIAQIVPNVRTQTGGIFDYAIRPEILPMMKIGILAEIPFHGRNIEGIIVSIKRTSPIPNLKSIIKIIDPVPVIDETHIKLSRWMSENYLEPFSKCLFENIVPTAKRIVKKESSLISVQVSKSIPNTYNRYLIIGDFNYRLRVYLKAIEKTLARKKQVIILVPDLENVHFFTKYLRQSISIIHSGLTRTQRYLEWQKIREGKSKIIIGSNSALFTPVTNMGLIIIDQEENETYKNGQSPRFHALKVTTELSKLTAANLLIGSITPRIETYYEALKGNCKLLKSNQKQKAISIVDMNYEKQILSRPLQDKIDEVLKNKQKIMLVLNRKGEGTKFSCADCGWINLCEKCGLPLIPQKDESVCYACEKRFPLPAVCPKCNGVHLKSFGVGTKKLSKFVQDFWPKSKVILIEKDTANNWRDFDIAIVTSFALKFSLPKIGLLGIIDADQSLNFPDFHSAEKTFQTLYKFLKIGERGIIQTHLPENEVISSLAKMEYNKFFLEELENREKNQFPPFTKITRLLFKNANEEICRKESERVFDLLNANRYTLNAILGPSPCFIKKERGKFRWQIIIKSSKPIFRYSSLVTLLRSLPKGWIIDVDPVNLL